MSAISQTTYTSEAGDVWLEEKRVIGNVWTFRRVNGRPVSATAKDYRIERGIRIGTWVFAIRRTKRVHKEFPIEFIPDAL